MNNTAVINLAQISLKMNHNSIPPKLHDSVIIICQYVLVYTSKVEDLLKNYF